MATLFMTLKLPLPLVDTLVRKLREVLGELKDHERRLLELSTRVAKMPRKDFIRAWEGNQTNPHWVDDVLKRKQNWSSGLRDVTDQTLPTPQTTTAPDQTKRVTLP